MSGPVQASGIKAVWQMPAAIGLMLVLFGVLILIFPQLLAILVAAMLIFVGVLLLGLAWTWRLRVSYTRIDGAPPEREP